MSFFNLGMQERLAKLGENHYLAKIEKLIDWSEVAKLLERHFPKKALGRHRYSPLKMFKAILLGQWHSLSDTGLEEALCVRLDFIAFTQFEVGEDLPDETTLCRFRNRLIEKGLHKNLLEMINFQLMARGVIVKKSEGAVMDATIVESSCRPTKQIDCTKRPHKVTASADVDATWVKKGKKSHFGYRGYVRTNTGQGFIEHLHMQPANVSEMHQLKTMLKGINGRTSYLDKGFACAENRRLLKEHGSRDGLMRKAVRGRPLRFWEKKRNKVISKSRYIIEQGFGTLKRKFRCGRASYRGIEKVAGQMHFKAICFNLTKAHHMVTI